MAPDGIVEAVDISGNRRLGLVACVEDGAPNELGFERLEECFDHRIVVAVAFAGHGDAHAMSIEFGLIVDRAILAAAVGVMDQAC